MPEDITDYSFETERLTITRLSSSDSLGLGLGLGLSNSVDKLHAKTGITEQICHIMSPQVTQSLPEGWQNIDTHHQAEIWMNEQIKQSCFHLIRLKTNNALIGFMFIYHTEANQTPFDIRIGYLIAEQYWGKGMATELIKGLINRCQLSSNIKSIIGGVEAENIGSIKVLQKNGFKLTDGEEEETLFYTYQCQ